MQYDNIINLRSYCFDIFPLLQRYHSVTNIVSAFGFVFGSLFKLVIERNASVTLSSSCTSMQL